MSQEAIGLDNHSGVLHWACVMLVHGVPHMRPDNLKYLSGFDIRILLTTGEELI
jgi:hypothetical protein